MNTNEVKQNLYNSLKELGLSEVEINLYSVSLTVGPASISYLAKQLNMSRPNVYKVIALLEKAGLTKFTEHNKYSRKFSVESPTVVLEKLREKKEKLLELDNGLVTSLPNLLTQYHQSESATKIKVLEGKEQFLKILNEILEQEEKEIQFFGSAQDFITFISWNEENEWIKKRMKRNIFIKSLIIPSQDAETLKTSDKDQMREIRILNAEHSFVSSFHLFANKMIVWQPKAPLAILIEDKYIIDMFKSIFYTLWKMSL